MQTMLQTLPPGLFLRNGKPTLTEVADHLGMSPRTLQRRLNDHNTSFSEMLDALRRELSADFRENRGLSAAEVAFLLGYSEPSAYQRAVRRWRTRPGTRSD